MSQADEQETRSHSDGGSATSAGPMICTAPMTREAFSAAFERCFRRVYAYVSRRVDDTAECERIVSAVLAANLDVLVSRGDELQEFRRLRASSDRLIGSESARSLSTDTIAP